MSMYEVGLFYHKGTSEFKALIRGLREGDQVRAEFVDVKSGSTSHMEGKLVLNNDHHDNALYVGGLVPVSSFKVPSLPLERIMLLSERRPHWLKTPQNIREFQEHFGVESDWHEPEEQDISARVEGDILDNTTFGSDMRIVLSHGGKDVALVNLAELFRMAAGNAVDLQ